MDGWQPAVHRQIGSNVTDQVTSGLHEALLDVEPFSPASIPPYSGEHGRVYDHIDQHLDGHLEAIRRWVRQPSVSATNDGIREMAELVRDDLQQLGCHEVEWVPTSGHPGLWACYDAGAPKTLLIYLMYDVQPADPCDWSYPPFGAQIIDHPLGEVLMSRGAVDLKGPERALLNALQSIIEVEGTLPVNLMITVEGEEELGSPHYDEIVERYEDRLRTCDGALLPFACQDSRGVVNLPLGVKGVLYFELEASGGPHGGPQRSEVGSAMKVLVDSPVWRLVHALASLTSADGNSVAVPGFQQLIRSPTDEERRLAAGMLEQWESREATLKSQCDVDHWLQGLEGKEALLRLLFDSSINIDGIWSGWTGPGVQTIIPRTATAKVDIRLVPDQQPDQVLGLLRTHLDSLGFHDVAIRPLAAYPASQVSVDAPIARSMISVFNKYGRVPSVAVRTPGSAPLHQFSDRLRVPAINGGLGHGAGAHGPDEYLVIRPKPGVDVAGLAEIEKSYVDLIYAFAAA